MAMDLSAIKSKLSSLQNQKQSGGQKRDMSLILWKPTVGEQTIRIATSAYPDIFTEDEVKPFKEIQVHYGIGNRTMISLTNFGEKDPIEAFAAQLKQGPYDKENWALSKKLSAKTRYFVPVIVRGEEAKGVRLWEFGTLVYQELLNIAEDPEVGDYTDPVNGRDIIIKTTSGDTNGTGFNQSKVRIRITPSPLSQNGTDVKKWLSEQPDPMTVFKRYTPEEMKTSLLEWLNPEEALPEPAMAPEVVEEPAKPAYTLNTTKKGAANIDEEFDALFSIKKV